MPGMPYHLEKGPVLSVLESFCNDDRARLVQALDDLENGVPLADLGPFDDPHLVGPKRPVPYQNGPQLRYHVYDHWLGRQQPGQTNLGPGPTGHWDSYTGPVEAIMRTTLIRAAQVALGIPGGKPSPATATRHWPIDFWWKCPQPWFEGWVTWRRLGLGERQGHVTVIFATPSDHGVVLRHPQQEADVDPQSVPTFLTAEQGSWLVSAVDHGQMTVSRPAPGGRGDVQVAVVTTRDGTDVATFAPHRGSGGIDSSATYTPPRVP